MEIIAEVLRITGQGGYPCLFHIITGAYCPGCGGTRAAILLLHGNILKSFYYNPLILYLAAALPFLALYFLYCRKKKKHMATRIWKTILYAGFLITTVNFLLKNYLLLFHQVDVLKILDSITGV